MRKQSWVFVALSLSLVAGILASEVFSHHYGHPDQETQQEVRTENETPRAETYRFGDRGFLMER